MTQQYPGDTATITTPAGDASTQRYEEARAAASRAMSTIAIDPDQPLRTPPAAEAEPEVDLDLLSYRGFKFGAAFFGWLIAISMSVLLMAAVAAAALGTAEILDYTTSDAKAQPGAASLTAAGVTIFMVTLAFYIGGYVAGRLARFDGGRQGFGVWMIALLVGALAGGAGWVLDSQYGLVDEINWPNVALADNTLLLGGIAAAAALLILTLLAAIVGGKSGRRYHDRIDELL
ncbi:hypothetical protein [Kribbella sp. VKM Ac-2566]|uniref:hypothetical protein n=1 Tax=Kribbella sp. VKM Ac-2566 TaxID=2512218 RepID=UPI001062FDE5|nr:hypothetical protein [Kribbella sp. VKM Ac-2566]TDW83241.1 hypothetical protein EV647_6945 [Kribbella sp. VKM Ac-2566]